MIIPSEVKQGYSGITSKEGAAMEDTRRKKGGITKEHAP